MKYYIAISFCCVCWEPITAYAKNNSDPEKEVVAWNSTSIEKLKNDLSDENGAVRLATIKAMAELKGDDAKRLLEEHYNKIPSDSSAQQREKIEIINILVPFKKGINRQNFLMDSVVKELELFKTAAKYQEDIYHPSTLLIAAIDILEKDGLTKDVRDKISLYANDPKMSRHIREELLAYLIWHDKSQDCNIRELVISVLTEITVRPKQAIPWDIYNDKEKRINYAKSKREKIPWLNSEAARLNAAREKVIMRAGITSVEELVLCLERENINSERKDYFAYLASVNLLKHARTNKRFSNIEEALTVKLENYVRMMQDKGAFSWRAYAATNLNCVNEHMGRDFRFVINPNVLDEN